MSRMQAPFVVVLSTAWVVAISVPASAAPATASAPVVFPATDTSPDTPGAPDIGNVTISDNPQGLITIQVSFVGDSGQPTSDNYGVYIDSDQNPTTGDIGGAGTDYLIEYDGTSNSLGLYKWDGKSRYAPAQSKSLSGRFIVDSQYFVFAASELGITDGFNFDVIAAVGSDPGSSSQADLVPESLPPLHYSMQHRASTAIVLTIADWATDIPHAGKLFRTALLVRRSDTGALLGQGSVRCTLSLRGRPVTLLGNRFSQLRLPGGENTAAVCLWRIPTSTAAAALTATETVTLGSSSVSKTFVVRVRK
jgi:hypothetical protein